MIDILLTLVAVALCSAAISFTITVTSIFSWFRESVSTLGHKMEELVHCPWCFSHYVTLLILLSSAVPSLPFAGSGVMIPKLYNFCITWFTVQCIVGLLHYVLLRAYEPVAKAMAMRMQQKLRARQKSEAE